MVRISISINAVSENIFQNNVVLIRIKEPKKKVVSFFVSNNFLLSFAHFLKFLSFFCEGFGCYNGDKTKPIKGLDFRTSKQNLIGMKSVKLKQFQYVSFPAKSIIPSLFQTSIASLSSSTSPSIETSLTSKPSTSEALTQEELTKINLLLPRLCLSNHLPTAIRLTSTALLRNPSLRSLSLSILVDSLTSQPDMALPMTLLTRLVHCPAAHSYLSSITTMFIASYFKKHKPKEALKVFHWMLRPLSPCVVDEKVCGILVHGFCRKGMVLEALKVLRAMVGLNLMPKRELGTCVYRGLLREARIKEAVALRVALGLANDVDDEEAGKKVLGLLDHMIAIWAD